MICFIFMQTFPKSVFFAEKRLTPSHFRPNIRPPLKRPYRLEA